MRREFQVRFCESLWGRFLWATRRTLLVDTLLIWFRPRFFSPVFLHLNHYLIDPTPNVYRPRNITGERI